MQSVCMRKPPIGRSSKTSFPLIFGRLTSRPDGSVVLIPDEPDRIESPIFIPWQKRRSARPGDRVLVRLPRSSRKGEGRSERWEAEVVRISRRGREEVIGKVLHFEGVVYAVPLEEHYPNVLRLAGAADWELAEGTIVAVSLLEHPLPGAIPHGALTRVLGDAEDPETPYRLVCHKYVLSPTFPDDVLQEADEARKTDVEDVSRRRDLRDLLTVTIDGPAARDFDDAISIDKRGRRYRLWVHIADVAHYVRPGSALDREAMLRGTSVYFPDRVIPMLPPRLSEDLCSLRPHADRLALTACMDLDRHGNVLHVDYCESVIRSDQRFTYDQVSAILRGDSVLRSQFQDHLSSLHWMQELSDILRRRRLERGALDVDLPKAEVAYDASGRVLDIVRERRNEAHRIIEEFMLVTNETVARTLERRKLPVLYRVHEPPDPTKIAQFADTASRFGYRLRPGHDGDYRPKDFNRLFRQLEGKPEATVLANLLLRIVPRAYYDVVDVGHFGLATSPYTHFTSPIRRYPDVVIHRVIKAACRTRLTGMRRLVRQLPKIARQVNEREHNAEEAQREIVRGIMARFIAERLGEVFEAYIVGVKHNGLFVELVDHAVDGFVSLCTLRDDDYVFHPEKPCLIGEKTKRVFRLGDRVRVRAEKAKPYRHLVEFSVA
ncbi:MAG: ribonuclease R [Nitrospirae bacterium]|nr:MAG: ribonuclease R [Nitrospirota bacterium]